MMMQITSRFAMSPVFMCLYACEHLVPKARYTSILYYYEDKYNVVCRVQVQDKGQESAAAMWVMKGTYVTTAP